MCLAQSCSVACEMTVVMVFVQHACVVRCFAMEEDAEFVYLALERCKHSLADVLTSHPSSEHCFVDSHSYPTPICMQVRPSTYMPLFVWSSV